MLKGFRRGAGAQRMWRLNWIQSGCPVESGGRYARDAESSAEAEEIEISPRVNGRRYVV